MDKKLIVANWKSHKNEAESIAFLKELSLVLGQVSQKYEIVVLPQYTALAGVKKYIQENDLSVSVGVQTVSSFGDGAYTGEVSARHASEFAKYALLNHSERRKYNRETDEDLNRKIEQCKTSGIIPMVCIQDETSFVPDGSGFIVYEPPSAISTFGIGKPETAQNIERVLGALKGRTSARVLYGGSVTSNNISRYLLIESLSGFLLGAASLEVSSFAKLLKKW